MLGSVFLIPGYYYFCIRSIVPSYVCMMF